MCWVRKSESIKEEGSVTEKQCTWKYLLQHRMFLTSYLNKLVLKDTTDRKIC